MPVRETDLRDDLVALIAAGRELSPDHDRALAEVFVDRMASRAAGPSRRRQTPALLRKPQRLLGAAVLCLACLLGAASVLSVHPASTSVPVQGPVAPKAPINPGIGKVPVVPPMVKAVPAPQAPIPPQAPEQKLAP